jgi:hypothetical protein
MLRDGGQEGEDRPGDAVAASGRKTGSKTMDEIEIIQVELPVEKFNLRIRGLIEALLEIDEELFNEQSGAEETMESAA